MADSPERTFLISTDCLGARTDPARLSEVWGFARDHPNFEGVEVIAFDSPFIGSLDHIIQRVKEGGFTPRGLHGRMGRPSLRIGLGESLFMALAEPHLVHTEKLLTRYWDLVDYALLHEPKLGKPGKLENLRAAAPGFSYEGSNKVVYAENQSGMAGSVGASLNQARRLQWEGIRVQVCKDLEHDRKAWADKNFRDAWRWQIEDTRFILEEAAKLPMKIPVLIHAPKGTRPSDSLPFDLEDDPENGLTDDYLREMGQVLRGHRVRIVLENQQAGIRGALGGDIIGLSKSQAIKQMDRNQGHFDRVVNAGWFD